MPAGEIEVFVEHRLGSAVRARRPVGGGCIHSAWRLELADGRCLFAKTNRAAALPLLEAEVGGLRALARWAPPELVLPQPLAVGSAGHEAVLLLSWLELAGGAAGGGGWTALGVALAQLHRSSAEAAAVGRWGDGSPSGFGFPADNFIGSTPQPNGWLPDWASFFAERRLGAQLCRAEQAGQPLRGAGVVVERARQLLSRHSCGPALVHGDLWSGNAALLVGRAGQPGCATIFDPAVYWGDREVDLAMARLFGGFPQAFFAGYEATWPLPADWPERLELYNLYHLLNHANLFGGGYWQQAQSSIDRVLAG